MHPVRAGDRRFGPYVSVIDQNRADTACGHWWRCPGPFDGRPDPLDHRTETVYALCLICVAGQGAGGAKPLTRLARLHVVVRVAVDDLGAGYANLDHVLRLKPD